jgi:TolB protein
MTQGVGTRPEAPGRRAGWRTPIFAVLTVLAVGGCGDPAAPDAGAVVEVDGRVERSSRVRLRLLVDGERVTPADATWTVSPAAAATLLNDTTLRLVEAGPIALTGTAEGVTADTVLEVEIPPRIAFDMSVDGNRDVYVAALDGRDLLRCTASPYSDVAPTARGGAVVFTSYRDGNAELYRVVPGGIGALGDPVRLLATEANETDPALAPDGSRVAYVSDASGVPKVWVAEADGTGGVRAAPDFSYPGALEGSPTWSPAGDRIAFLSTDAGGADLYVVDLATGEVSTLVATASPEVEPAWSPDGDRVVYAAAVDGQTDLYLLDRTAGSSRRLTARAETDGEPAWLPDGRIVYVAWTGGVPALRWLDPETGGPPVAIPLKGEAPRGPTALGEGP